MRGCHKKTCLVKQMEREEEKKIPYQKVNFQRDDEEDAGCLNIILKFLIIMGINLFMVLVIIFMII